MQAAGASEKSVSGSRDKLFADKGLVRKISFAIGRDWR
jgi:hypothetical protein